MESTGPKPARDLDPVTIAAIAVLAYSLANIVHEGLGHGGGQFHAFRRWQGLAPLAVKKRHAKPFLQLADLVADSRLSDMQFISRLGKAVAAGRRFKAFQGIQGGKARHNGSMKITHTLCERSSFDSSPTCRPKGQPDLEDNDDFCPTPELG